MNSYLVIHDIQSFRQHQDWIGREGKLIPPQFRELNIGDGIVYYCTGDQVITGTFQVASKAKTVRDDQQWVGPHTVVVNKPVALAKPPCYLPVEEMLEGIAESI